MGNIIIKSTEFLDLINKRNMIVSDCISSNTTGLKRFFDKHNIDYLKITDENNPFYNSALGYRMDDLDTVERIIMNSIKIINGDNEKYHITRKQLTNDFINNNFYTTEEAAKILRVIDTLRMDYKGITTTDGEYPYSDYPFMKSKKLPHIEYKSKYGHPKSCYLKQLIDDLATEFNNLITSKDAYEIVKKKVKDFDLYFDGFVRNLTREGFDYKSTLADFKVKCILVEKSRIDDIIDFFKKRQKFINVNTPYEKYLVYKSYQAVNKDIPETLNLLDKYCLSQNNNTKRRNTMGLFSDFKNIFDEVNSGLHKEIYDLTNDELELFIGYVESNYKSHLECVRNFYNYAVMKVDKSDKKLPIVAKEKEKVKAYDLDLYFAILAKIMSKMCDKSFIDEILDNWALASLTLYIYTHYISVWRKSDILFKLPKPNLNLIGFKDGKNFKEWINNDNIFTEEMGRKICKDIESKIYAYRLEAHKNNNELLLYVSEYMYSTYGLLLCICEANRQTTTNYHAKKDLLIIRSSVDTTRQKTLIKSIIGDLANKFPVGCFSNIRANKSFETYVAKKSEEWNIGVGYIMASIFRGHTINESLISEVTKIYIDRDINEASVRAFNMGIMSGVKYKLFEAMGFKIIGKDKRKIDEKVSKIKLTPYQTELVMKNLHHQSELIDEFLKKVLSEGRKSMELTLFQLLFGRRAYGKHLHTKCLYRAFVASKTDEANYINNMSMLPCINRNSEGCIGCPFLIAERYFIYELSRKLNEAIILLENAKSNVDKQIHFNRLTNNYMPLIQEAYDELGVEYVEEVLDIDRLMLIVNKTHKELK